MISKVAVASGMRSGKTDNNQRVASNLSKLLLQICDNKSAVDIFWIKGSPACGCTAVFDGVARQGITYCKYHFASFIYLPTERTPLLKFPALEKRSQKLLGLP